MRAKEQPSASQTCSSGSLQKNKHLHLGHTAYVFNDNQSVWTKHLKFHMTGLLAFPGNISRWRMTHLFAEITQLTQQPGLFQGGVLLCWEGAGEITHTALWLPEQGAFWPNTGRRNRRKTSSAEKKSTPPVHFPHYGTVQTSSVLLAKPHVSPASCQKSTFLLMVNICLLGQQYKTPSMPSICVKYFKVILH